MIPGPLRTTSVDPPPDLVVEESILCPPPASWRLPAPGPRRPVLGRHHALAGVALGVLATLAGHGSALAAITRVSVSTSGLQGDGRSGGNAGGAFRVGISADGRHVVFESAATNLVPGDTNAETDILVHDRQTGATTRVSVASDGSEVSGSSSRPAISADGRYVAFHSGAPLLVTHPAI